jgi:hypothetical protein
MADYGAFKKIKSDAIINGSITANKLASDSITTAKINNGAVSSSKILSGEVGVNQLDSSLDLNSKTITYRPLTNADFSSSAAISTSKISGLGTLATLNSVGASQIDNGAINSTNFFTSGSRFHSAVFMGQTSGNPGSTQSYINFIQNSNSDSSVFELVTTGNFGVKIKRAGQFVFYFTNEMITNTNSGYVTVTSRINSSIIGYQLISSHTEWDCISICGAYVNNANDDFQLKFESGTSASSWSQLQIHWVGFI